MFVNMLHTEELPEAVMAAGGEIPADEIEAGLQSAEVQSSPELVESLQSEARDHAIRVGLQRRERRV